MVELPAPGAPMTTGRKLTLTPVGTPEAERPIELLKPPLTVVVMVTVPRPFWPIVSEDGVAEMVKLPVAAAGTAHNRRVKKETAKTALVLRVVRPKFSTPEVIQRRRFRS